MMEGCATILGIRDDAPVLNSKITGAEPSILRFESPSFLFVIAGDAADIRGVGWAE
jgi:hypothetical protein